MRKKKEKGKKKKKISNIIDIDECKLGTFICSSREVCVNTPGKYECQCKEGYIRNGTFCSGIKLKLKFQISK